MKSPMKKVFVCVVTTALIAGAASIAVAKRGGNTSLPMNVRAGSLAVCQLEFAGYVFSLPDDENSMVAALQKLRRDWRSISISGGPETPYRCIGHAIYLSQRAGFKKVGFIAEPPAR